jgi:hypothetical protein
LEEKLVAYKTENTGVEILLRRPRDNLYPQKFTLTTPTRGGRSVGVVCSQTEATGFFFIVYERVWWASISNSAADYKSFRIHCAFHYINKLG